MATIVRTRKYLVLCCLSAMLAACAAREIAPDIAEIEVSEPFSGVAIFNLKPDSSLRAACGHAECAVNTVGAEDLASALRESAAFDKVDVGGTDQDFGIAIGTSVPTDRPRAIAVTSLVLWRGQQLDEFTYLLPYASPMAQRADEGASIIARSITSQILRDIVHRRIFTPERVHEVLQSSDYGMAMAAPEELGAFVKYNLHKFVDPLLGVAIRYRHRHPEGGHIDVFVYPIRASQWRVAHSILTQESRAVRRDLSRLEQQGVHQLVRLRADELLRWTGHSGTVELLRFAGELANADFQPYDTSTYMYLEGDKLVKVRATRPRNAPAQFDPDQFVKGLIATLKVPPESAYMKQVRQLWSENSDG